MFYLIEKLVFSPCANVFLLLDLSKVVADDTEKLKDCMLGDKERSIFSKFLIKIKMDLVSVCH